jgi:hypothetical protein
MSTFEEHGYKWRETYFVMFPASRRPPLAKVERMLKTLSPRFELVNAEADDKGQFESLTIRAPQDYAAMDISYESGDEVTEQVTQLQQEMKGLIDAADRPKLAELSKCDAKFDILHFEQQIDAVGDEEDDEGDMLDPSALLSVMDALVELTGGIGVDPQSGTLM